MRLLVVEDDATVSELLKDLLSSAGYEVIVAADGVEGVDAARSERPDLVLLDAMLPRLSGLEVCRTLRRDELLKRVPVLMLTAMNGAGDMDRAFAAGVDVYMNKPVQPARLLEKIAALLKDGRPGA